VGAPLHSQVDLSDLRIFAGHCSGAISRMRHLDHLDVSGSVLHNHKTHLMADLTWP
jgi:hypothetical protein